MAQVLAPIVQTAAPITMLHSSTDAFQSNSPPQSHQQQRQSQMPRSQVYNIQNAGIGYRSTSAPISPYAFSTTPQLRQENKPLAPVQNIQPNHSARLGHPSHASSSSDSTVSTSGSSNRSLVAPAFGSKDDLAIGEVRKSTTETTPSLPLTLSSSTPDLSLFVLDAPAKPSPDRYRRGGRRADSSSTVATVTPTSAQTQQSPNLAESTAAMVSSISLDADLPMPSRPSHARANSVDDAQLPRQSAADQAKRYRRRSLGNFEPTTGVSAPTPPAANTPAAAPLTQTSQESKRPANSSRPSSRAGSSHERQGSTGSASTTSTRPSSRQESSSLRNSSATTSNLPSRGSAEPAKRVAHPSPLSKPILPSGPETPILAKKTLMPTEQPSSPSKAVQHLTALNDKESGRGMKSRLRRAFSFGSAAELRKASAENSMSAKNKLHKEQYQDELDPEQQAIIAKQEAAGIGAGIYSGQGGFSGSTDNLSISSTASSASIMLRKMGNGMRKGGRSIKGLFRPKSVIGVPAADGPIVQASAAQVSMVTVEAERERVNVNVNPHERGGTGYPRLERNSLEIDRSAMPDVSGSSNTPQQDSWSRKSIIGGERERAEVLSSIKKGILKRAATDTSSPITRPNDIPHPNDSTPKSSAPSTPNDDHSRSVQVLINGEDYFGVPPRLGNGSTRSLPNTPSQGSRNISFSPRIQFHDAWSSSEYDRRGDIATCNRLTPMLAQQIKEELNTFKMEMEVHELSKPYTHFF